MRDRYPNDDLTIDWSQIRVICIAPEYKKYDFHAVQMMGANIELWQYRYFRNDARFLEEVYRRSTIQPETAIEQDGKNPAMVAAGNKAAMTRSTGEYTVEPHFNKISSEKRHLLDAVREFVLSLDEAVEEVPKKYYVAYTVSQNFACLEVHKMKVVLFLKLKPSELQTLPSNGRDVTNIGHYGTGDFELSIGSEDELEQSKQFIRSAFDNIGGN